jgi:hypothetical protein
MKAYTGYQYVLQSASSASRDATVETSRAARTVLQLVVANRGSYAIGGV